MLPQEAALPPEGRDVDNDETASEDRDEGFDAEISDLPASSSGAAPRFWSARAGSLTPRQRLLRLLSAAGALVLALAAILLVTRPDLAAVLTLATPMPSTSAWTPVPNLIASGKQACIRDASWSPDGQRIAILAETPDCARNVYQPGFVRLYEVEQQRTYAEYPVDGPIFAALGVAPPASTPTPTPTSTLPTPLPWQTPTIFHYSVSWSHDFTELAVSFLAVLAFTPKEVDVPGLALISPNGAQERVLLGPRSSVETSTFKEWDLLGNQLADVSYPPLHTSEFSALDLTPALGYAWGQGGTLVPQSSSSQHGDPIGDPAFAIWQPGEIVAVTPPPESDITSPPAYVFVTTLTAWSPDGRYIAAGASTAIRLSPAGHDTPTQQALSWLGITQLPVVAPTPCLQSAIDAIATPSETFGQTSVEVAWQPHGGGVLAVSQEGDDLTLFDCATGRQIRQILSVTPNENYVSFALRWSPDGQTIVLPSGALVTVGALDGEGR